MEKTTCDWTVERLPWWANGTLEEAEAESVRAHLAECADCRAELEETRAALAVYGAHPSIEALVAFVEGSAGAGESRQTVEAHVAHCAACREEVALLRESRAAIAAEPGAAGGAVRAFVPPARGGSVPGRRGVDLRSLAMAASLLLFVVAAGGWLTSGRLAERRGDQVAELERRLAAVEAVAERPTAPEAPGPVAGEPAADAEALAAELEQKEQQIAELQDRVARLSERPPEMLAGGPTIPWEVGDVVVRGARQDPEPRSEDERDYPADAPMASVFIDRIAPGTYGVTVETLEGRIVDRREDLPTRRSSALGTHLTVVLPLAELPDGPLRLRLYAGGEEVRSLLLRPTE